MEVDINMVDFKEKYGNNYVGIYASPYDERDYKLNELIPKGAIDIPREYSSELPPFIYDQGTSSECAACSYSTIRYMQESDTEYGGSGIKERFSPSFTYSNRLEGEDFEGMYLRSVCKKGKEGSIPWSVFPGFYTYAQCKMKFLLNKSKWLEMAKPFRISSYYQCTSREQIQLAIIECKAVLAGINVLPCIYEVKEDGIVNYDKNKDLTSYGGHAVTVVGWRFDDNNNLWYKVINSWGTIYGDNGIMWIPEKYPWLEQPWAIVDYVIETKWEDYKNKYNL
jgi:hypothetical protein